MDEVFIVPFHVKRGQKSIIPEGLAGAYVSCYVAAKDYKRAVDNCLSALRADGMQVAEVLHPINVMSLTDWSKHVFEQWPNQANQLPNQQEFEGTIKNGNVVYGPFGSY